MGKEEEIKFKIFSLNSLCIYIYIYIYYYYKFFFFFKEFETIFFFIALLCIFDSDSSPFPQIKLNFFHINCKPYQSLHEPHELDFFKQNRVWKTTFTPIKLGCQTDSVLARKLQCESGTDGP